MLGREIEHYRIESKLGQGGYGDVYRAVDTRLERPVALKILRPLGLDAETLRRRFLREARAMAAINHPNVVTIHEIREEGEELCLCTEFIDGPTLADYFESTPRTVEAVLEIGIALLHALEALHDKGIVHRDLKPANVMRTESGVVKLMDFGIAVGDELDSVTVEGSVSGTVGYMSPEQLRGLRLDARSDLFSLGAVLYECLTGNRPFGGQTASECIAATLANDPEPIGNDSGSIPPRLVRAITKSLAKDRKERFADAAAMRAELEGIAASLGSDAPDESPAPNAPAPAQADARTPARPASRIPKLRIGLGLGFVTLVLVLYVLFSSSGIDGPNSTSSTNSKSTARGATGGATGAAEAPLGFEAKILLVNEEDDSERTLLADGDVIREGDRIHCEVLADRAFHLYVFYRDSGGAWAKLFPSGSPGEPSNPLAESAEGHRIPRNYNLRVDDQAGEERFWFVASEEPVSRLEDLLTSLDLPPGPAAIPSSAFDEAQEIVLRGFQFEAVAHDPEELPAVASRHGVTIVRTLLHE